MKITKREKVVKSIIKYICDKYSVKVVQVKRKNCWGYSVKLDHNIYWKEQSKMEREIRAILPVVDDIYYIGVN